LKIIRQHCSVLPLDPPKFFRWKVGKRKLVFRVSFNDPMTVAVFVIEIGVIFINQ